MLTSLGVVNKGMAGPTVQALETHLQIKNLQDDKLDLLARISQMVSRTELLSARAEASARQGEVQVLEQQLLKQRQSVDGLNEKIQSLQEENSKLQVAIQVRNQQAGPSFTPALHNPT